MPESFGRDTEKPFIGLFWLAPTSGEVNKILQGAHV